jgi:ComF family protein
VEKYEGIISSWKPDYLVPVPLHTLKKAERGYNQSYYIAKGISKRTKIPIAKNIVRRIKHTQSQTNLTSEERKANIEGAFKISKNQVIKSSRIILVDDVITTGATISGCGSVLLSGGVEEIFALSAGIAE